MKFVHFINSKKRFYLKILSFSLASFFMLIVIYLALSIYTGYKSLTENISNLEWSQNERIEKNFNSNLSQISIKLSNLTDLTIPIDYIQNNDLYWSKRIFGFMIKNNFSGLDYISYFSCNIADQNYFYSKSGDHLNLQNFTIQTGLFSPYNFYISKNNSWPFYLLMSRSTSIKDTTSCSTLLNTFALSSYIFSNLDKTGRYEYIVGSNGRILLTNDTNNTFKMLSDVHPDITLPHNKTIKHSSVNGNNCYVFTTVSNTSDFYFISFVPKSIYTQNRIATFVPSFAIATLMIFLAIILSKKIVSTAYRPIAEMVNTLNYYIPTDIKPYETEAAFLIEKMKETLNKQQELEAQIPITMQKLQEAQFASMQSQINAHFLFNTLENIKSISVNQLGINNSIETSILLLNDIINESMRQKNSIVPLEKELELATDYLELMKLRFENFKYKFNTDISLNNCSVFKFSIQPVLENCFVHAFENTKTVDDLILINTYHVDSVLYIAVKDNGSGFNESVINEINNPTPKVDLKDVSKHLGLRNINMRIHSVFGNKYGILIKNDKIGSTVIIRYPITPYKNN